MPEFHNIPIFDKTYEFYKLFYSYLPSFPKKDRYTFAQKCELIILDMIEGVIAAGVSPKPEKFPILKALSIKLDVLKVLIRLGRDTKIIENNKYAALEERLQEIGKMLGGWIKSISML